jgi:hypothetical protein
MGLGLLLTDPERAFAGGAQPTTSRLLALLAFFSACFGVLAAADIYLMGRSQFEIFLVILDAAGASGRLAQSTGVMADLGGLLLKAAVASALAAAAFKLAAIAAMSVLTYLLMRWMGSKIPFNVVLRPAVLLMPVPVIIFAFSTTVNAVSYGLTGIVPLSNTALIPAAGWILYCCALASRFLNMEGLAGPRRLLPLVPIAVMAVWNVLYAACVLAWPLLLNSIIEQALEGMFP